MTNVGNLDAFLIDYKQSSWMPLMIVTKYIIIVYKIAKFKYLAK